MTQPGTVPAFHNLRLELRDLITKVVMVEYETPPDTWLLCDGSAYDPEVYPELHASLAQCTGYIGPYLPPASPAPNIVTYIKARPYHEITGCFVGQMIGKARPKDGEPPKHRKWM